MKFKWIIFIVFLLASCGQTNSREKPVTKNDTYKIILRTEMPEPEKGPETGGLYTTEIDKLIEPVKLYTKHERATN